MSTLYLHIGMPKTGTSYIQSFLHTNNEVLKQQGYVYPDFGVKFDKIGALRNGHFLISHIKDENGNRLKDKEKEIETECFDKLLNLFDVYPNVILSEESIWNSAERKRGKNFWKKLKSRLDSRGIELKTIVYLRRQDLFIQSFWAQHIKKNLVTNSLREFLTLPRFKLIQLDYYKRLNKICEDVGKENMLVRVYEKGQYIGQEKTIVSDFLATVGLEYNDEYVQPPRLANISLTGIYLETKRELNKIEGFVERKGYVQDLLREVVELNGDVRSISCNEFMSGEDVASFLKKYDESNARVAREYLSREDGKLFYDEQKVSDNTPEYTVSDYVGVLAQMIELQNNNLIDTQEQVKQLKNENKELAAQNKKLQSTVDWVTTSFPKKVARKLRRIFGCKRYA